MDPKDESVLEKELVTEDTGSNNKEEIPEYSSQTLDEEKQPAPQVEEAVSETTIEEIPAAEIVVTDNASSTDMVEEKEQNSKVQLISIDSESGVKSYKVQISPEVAQQCLLYDREWDVDFRKYIGPEYPYTMSPETTRVIAEASTDMKRYMLEKGFNINKWEVGDQNKEPYVMSVLRRVCITDTIEPIIDNTDAMARYLETLSQNNPQRMLRIRSFFTGAAVAEKCLVARLHQLGVENFNLVTTDSSAESVAIAALNLSLWNELLPEKDRYDIRIVNGEVPEELYSKSKTIVLQVGDALGASENDSVHNPAFDALLLDNGLPYVSSEFGSKLVSNVAKNMGKDGLYMAALGLDEKIKVEIETSFHLRNIIKSMFTDLSRDPKIGKFTAPYDYPHYYGFSVDKEGNILINQVLSKGAAKMYKWLGLLVRSNMTKFKEVMAAIKSATELSRAKVSVVTPPFKSHVDITKTLTEQGYSFEELERPLEYEKFGWQKIGEDLYTKDGANANGTQMMDACRAMDPLVLRKTRLHIGPTQ